MELKHPLGAFTLQLQLKGVQSAGVAEINAVLCRIFPLSGFENPMGSNRLRQYEKFRGKRP
jgi:hypothetical protein